MQKEKRQNNSTFAGKRAAGFSLFELVVFILSVAIIYAYAANRFAEFPGEAERANFLAISTQLQSSVNLEMMFGMAAGRMGSAGMLEGANPMELVLEPPSNYLGAFDAVDLSRLPRRSWYFDRQAGELVYLVNDSTGVYLLRNGREVPTQEIRFRIVAEYGEVDVQSGLPVKVVEERGVTVEPENRRREFNGVVMRPVEPYRWREADEGLLAQQALADLAG